MKPDKSSFSNLFRQMTLLICLLLSLQSFAQQEKEPVTFGIQAGISTNSIDDVVGPTLSFHYAHRTDKVIQLESILFMDYMWGRTWWSGRETTVYGVGLAGGIRLNILPKRNWNPSLVFMIGAGVASEKFSNSSSVDFGQAINIDFSNMLFKKHMINIGLHVIGDIIFAPHLKYGFWF